MNANVFRMDALEKCGAPASCILMVLAEIDAWSRTILRLQCPGFSKRWIILLDVDDNGAGEVAEFLGIELDDVSFCFNVQNKLVAFANVSRWKCLGCSPKSQKYPVKRALVERINTKGNVLSGILVARNETIFMDIILGSAETLAANATATLYKNVFQKYCRIFSVTFARTAWLPLARWLWHENKDKFLVTDSVYTYVYKLLNRYSIAVMKNVWGNHLKHGDHAQMSSFAQNLFSRFNAVSGFSKNVNFKITKRNARKRL